MPIYEFCCDSCQHVFEELQSYSDPPPESCPQCKQAAVRRMISNTTFHLKGGGWYATDNPASSGSSSASVSAPSAAVESTSAVSSSAPESAPAVEKAVVPGKSSAKIDS